MSSLAHHKAPIRKKQKYTQENSIDSLTSHSYIKQNEFRESKSMRKIRQEHEASVNGSKESRNISRHRRISAPDNYHPTIVRNIDHPEFIEEYEVTERKPLETVQPNKSCEDNQMDFHKYTDKYSLTKN